MRYYLRGLILFILIMAFFSGVILNRYQKRYADHFHSRVETFNSAYHSIIDTYRLVSKTIVDEVIAQPEILYLLRQIVDSEGLQRDRRRGELYRKIYPIYQRVNQYSIRVLQFHFPNMQSMLRMHAPEENGDDLAPYRHSIVQAHDTKKEVHGYETGRLLHGFRHIYPLFDGDGFLGSVDVSNSFTQVKKELQKHAIDKESDYQLMLLKADIWHKLNAGGRDLYRASTLDSRYLIENENSFEFNQMGGTTTTSSLTAAIYHELINDPELAAKFSSQNDFFTVISLGQKRYSVLFHTIENVDGNHAAYLVAMTHEPFLETITGSSRVFGIIGFFTALSFALLYVRQLKARGEQKQTHIVLNALTDHMGEAVYATNNKGIITYVNPESLRLLGFKKGEMIGKDAHKLFHVDDDQHQRGGCTILNSILQNITFQQVENTFCRQDAQHFPVELTCTPIRSQGEFLGTVTMFHDISDRIKKEKVLQETQQELLQSNQRLECLSRLDGLTGISNRRELDIELNRRWQMAIRYSSSITLLMIDIDFFKNYNDSYGHLDGDQCLKHVAQVIHETCSRPGDFVARYGGEEFAVLLPESSLEGSLSVAERIRHNIEKLRIPHDTSQCCQYVSLSIGVAIMSPKDMDQIDDLIKLADAQLYQAKENGRNCVNS